jgi:hypothetical protein
VNGTLELPLISIAHTGRAEKRIRRLRGRLACPPCGEAAKFVKHRPKARRGLLRYRRAYYHCDHCHTGSFPWDVHVGLTHHRRTPAAEEASSLAGTAAGRFGGAAQKLLRKLSGLALGTSTVRRVTEAAGRRAGESLKAGHALGARVQWRWHRDRHGRTVASVSVEATGPGMQAPGGGKAEGRMAWIGMA